MKFEASGHLDLYERHRKPSADAINWLQYHVGPKPYNLLCVKKFTELLDLVTPLQKDSKGLVFRGHADQRWKLRSKFQRLLDDYPREYPLPKSGVYDQILNIAKCKLKLSDQDQFDGQLWAELQHYNVSTPLLDWTESVDIALFFATQYAPSPKGTRAALFVANPTTINQWSDASKNRPWNNWKFLLPVRFFDARIMAQKGLFMSQGIEPEPFEKSLRRHSCPDGTVLKIIFSRDLCCEVKNYLQASGITWGLLFPRHMNEVCSEVENEIRMRISDNYNT